MTTQSGMAAAFGASAASAPVALAMKADLAAGRLTMAEYAREARTAGVPAPEVAAALEQHAAASRSSEGGPSPAASECVLPAGTYYGRTHASAVRIVDGIYVPVDAQPAPAAAAPAVSASLAWLREHGGAWGLRAAERLGPENDFLPDLELHDESRGGRVADGKIGPEGALHIATALGANEVLTRLNLGQNAIGEEGAAHVARALAANRALTALNLTGNGLGDAGAAHVAAALHENPSLLEVDLSGNGVGEATRELLRAAWGSRNEAGLRVDTP